jgi:hypothetical protein
MRVFISFLFFGPSSLRRFGRNFFAPLLRESPVARALPPLAAVSFTVKDGFYSGFFSIRRKRSLPSGESAATANYLLNRL